MRSEGEDAIFSTDDIKEMVKHTITLEYDEVTDVTPDVRLTLYNAGHILGSAMVHLHVGNGLHNILYTGDFKFARTTLLEPAVTNFPRLETLIIESTYGGKDNILPPKKECDLILANLITNIAKQGGKILIPVLGSGRAQEMMLIIEELVRNGQLQKIPVYIDGMVWDVTSIHTAYPEFLNSTVRKQIFHKDENPFLSDMFKNVGSPKERKMVMEEVGSCVILATSGMLIGGPSVEYFKMMADNPKNLLIFVSYQSEGSLGRRIQKGEHEIGFATNGSQQEILRVNMQVETIEGFSGHSGRKQLMNFVHRVNPKPKKVIIVHGESSRCLDLASSIHKQARIETIAPRNLDALRIR
jgi:predicted metal-dependent RNase